MTRIGRPKKYDAKTERVCVRMSKNDLKRLKYICQETGKSPSELIRSAFDKWFDEMLKW